MHPLHRPSPPQIKILLPQNQAWKIIGLMRKGGLGQIIQKLGNLQLEHNIKTITMPVKLLVQWFSQTLYLHQLVHPSQLYIRGLCSLPKNGKCARACVLIMTTSLRLKTQSRDSLLVNHCFQNFGGNVFANPLSPPYNFPRHSGKSNFLKFWNQLLDALTENTSAKYSDCWVFFS